MKLRNANVDSPLNSYDIQQSLQNVKDPSVFLQNRQAFQRKKYNELLQKISFLDDHLPPEERRYDYPDDFRPFVFFFKFLARRPDVETTSNLHRLKLWLPDTVLSTDDNSPMWFYSDDQGYVYRTDNFTAKNIVNKIGSFSSPDELVAVLKKPQGREFTYTGNDIRLMTLKDVSMVAQSIVGNRGDTVCLQKYVKSIGPKAFICRTCWRRDRNPYVWVITNNRDYERSSDNASETLRYIANPKIMGSCTIINSIRGRYVDETAPYVANIVKFVEYNMPDIKFEEFVADFIKDESGTWWLVNIRGFVLVNKIGINPKAFLAGPDDLDFVSPKKAKAVKIPEGYQKVATCKYCEQLYTVDELMYTMTLKAIIQCDRHLLHRGKSFKWLERSNIETIDTKALLREHKVCKSCYKLHQETEKLRQIEFEFAKALGIPVNADKRPDTVSVTGLKNKDPLPLPIIDSTAQSQLATEREMMTKSPLNHAALARALAQGNAGESEEAREMPMPKGVEKYMKKYRLMLYLHMLYDIPKDMDASRSYSIEYTILGQRQKYKIDLMSAFSVNGDIVIPLNKLRVFYMFSYSRKGINEYINEQKAITLNLYCDTEKIGTVKLPLTDFLSDKVIKREMFKVFSGRDLPILSWGVKATIGITEGDLEDIDRINLAEHKHIYLTNTEYFTCEPLPREWIQVFEENQHNLAVLLNRSEIKAQRGGDGTPNARQRGSIAKRLNSSRSRSQNTSKALITNRDSPSRDEPTNTLKSAISPMRSLFADEKSFSRAPTEDNIDESSTDVLKKILTESILDYEKGGKMMKKKASTKAETPTQKSEKSSKSYLKSWASVSKKF